MSFPLERPSPEIQQQICTFLDLQSLTNFRLVNKNTRDQSLREFKTHFSFLVFNTTSKGLESLLKLSKNDEFRSLVKAIGISPRLLHRPGRVPEFIFYVKDYFLSSQFKLAEAFRGLPNLEELSIAGNLDHRLDEYRRATWLQEDRFNAVAAAISMSNPALQRLSHGSKDALYTFSLQCTDLPSALVNIQSFVNLKKFSLSLEEPVPNVDGSNVTRATDRLVSTLNSMPNLTDLSLAFYRHHTDHGENTVGLRAMFQQTPDPGRVLWYICRRLSNRVHLPYLAVFSLRGLVSFTGELSPFLKKHRDTLKQVNVDFSMRDREWQKYRLWIIQFLNNVSTDLKIEYIHASWDFHVPYKLLSNAKQKLYSTRVKQFLCERRGGEIGTAIAGTLRELNTFDVDAEAKGAFNALSAYARWETEVQLAMQGGLLEKRYRVGCSSRATTRYDRFYMGREF